MEISKIHCYFGRKLYYLMAILLIGSVIFTGCKEDGNHDMDDMDDMDSIPYLSASVYIANEDDGTITVIDPIENVSIGTIELSADMSSMLMPHNVQVAPDGKSVWVTGMPETEGGMEQVVVIDPASNHNITHRINVGTEQHLAHVVFDSTSNYAFVTANEANQVIQINAKTYVEVKRFDLDSAHGPHGLRYSRGNLYVANIEANSMSIINIASEQITEIPLGGMAVQTAVTSDGNYVFISLYDTKEIARYDLQSQQLTKIALPSGSLGPIQMYPTPDNQLLYVCDQGGVGEDAASNKVYVIDIATSTVTNTIVAGYAAHGVVVNNDGTKAYVTNSLSNTLSVIDVATQAITNTITVGKSPNGVSYRFSTGGMQ